MSPDSKVRSDPDCAAIVRFLNTAEGGRKTPVRTGYRPNHLVTDDCLTCGIHEYPVADWVKPGETVEALITFSFPHHYPKCLWRGKTIRIQEGARTIGDAEIVEIYNPVLNRDLGVSP